jgi:hypothetical protein
LEQEWGGGAGGLLKLRLPTKMMLAIDAFFDEVDDFIHQLFDGW